MVNGRPLPVDQLKPRETDPEPETDADTEQDDDG